MSGADHYEVLNVERTATTAEIKTAYRKLVRQVHPDQGGNAALFRVVQDAWTTLSDPAKRAAYDRQLARAEAPDTQTAPPPRTPEPEPEDPFTWTAYQPWTGGQEQSRRQQSQNDPYGSPYERYGRHQPYEPVDEPAPGPLPTVDVGPIHAVPVFNRLRRPALVCLGVTAALLVGLYVLAAVTDGWSVVYAVGIACMLLVAMPPHWSRRVPLRRVFKTFGGLTALAFLTFGLFGPRTETALVRVLCLVVVAALVVTRILTGQWSKSRALDQAIDRQATYEFNLWGRPGEPLLDGSLAVPLTTYDVLLQRRTAALLDPVMDALPAAKLIHSPQLGGVTLDHMLINGRRVALIVSLVGPPGTYTLDSYGSLVLDGTPIDSPSSALATTVEAWRSLLRTADVRGYLLIHPDSAGRVTTPSAETVPVACLSPRSAAQALLAWLHPEGSLVDRQLLDTVLHHAPYEQL